ncbi:glycerol uptake operon antiterminator regulatory protein [Paenibacillus sp. J31TS4]|uniref:glycerol-3-phosphate responsive antiterminator n=1 Tax=Paenibacillus sp. J31TS4 TaxID=2807195 RepID=UPI001B0296D8|nr:glycerol-3-phosphate responsive antiterminator [Paenibacillus sp. J31TS4]GIP41064.1 glycerol uptake operon antiterminator regulatory protein [Paenibacillus sp. J31TS4]
MESIVDMVEHQVIASVRSDEELADALSSSVNVIFLLNGSILNLQERILLGKRSGKRMFVHLDFTEGIAPDKSGIRFMANDIRPDGILSTRNHVVGLAKEYGLMAIQRLFLIDSTAIRNGLRAIHTSGADAVEIMPGVMPKVIRELTDLTDLPIIAGGLVRTREDVLEALRAGALAVSVGTPELWRMDL